MAIGMIRQRTIIILVLLAIAHGSSASTPEEAFSAANDIAMARMMTAMSIKPSGNVDVDFVDMMEPHHQGAIDMAVLELRYGRNERLRRIAQEIIVDQQQEIDAMRLALDRKLSKPAPAPTVVPSAAETDDNPTRAR